MKPRETQDLVDMGTRARVESDATLSARIDTLERQVAALASAVAALSALTPSLDAVARPGSAR